MLDRRLVYREVMGNLSPVIVVVVLGVLAGITEGAHGKKRREHWETTDHEECAKKNIRQLENRFYKHCIAFGKLNRYFK